MDNQTGYENSSELSYYNEIKNHKIPPILSKSYITELGFLHSYVHQGRGLSKLDVRLSYSKGSVSQTTQALLQNRVCCAGSKTHLDVIPRASMQSPENITGTSVQENIQPAAGGSRDKGQADSKMSGSTYDSLWENTVI